MDKKKFVLLITIDQDPVPGAFHTAGDTEVRLQNMVNAQLGHYNPKVEFLGVDETESK